MQNVVIKHNPYKLISTIQVNGKEPAVNSKLMQFLDQRFQMWVDQIPTLLAEEYNDDEFDLTFYGTELDYQDLLSATKSAKDKGLKFNIKKKDAKEFGEKEVDIQNLFKKICKLPFPELQSPAVADAFEKAFNEEFEVNVVATMSAGKSTLINALLGEKLMPSKQGACTATITKIKDNDEENFKAKVFDSEKNEIGDYPVLDYKIMSELNKNQNVSEIQVEGNIPFVTADEISLILIDTPGPDNARDKHHGLVTAKALEESSKMLVLFVMNGGKLHDEAQDNFLRRIAKSMSVGGKQSRDRFIFVINKLDTYDEEDDDIENETIPDTIRYLEEMGIKNPNVFPAAVFPALLIRQYQNTDDENKRNKIMKQLEPIAQKMIDQEQLHLEKYPQLVRSSHEKIQTELKNATEKGDMLGEALIHTGIRGIEETIRMYVTKYCRPAKITNVVNTFKHELDSVEAFERTKKEIASREGEQIELKLQIEQLEYKLKSKKENDLFKKKIASLDIKTNLETNLDNLIYYVQCPLTESLDGLPEEMEEDEAKIFIKKFSKIAKKQQDEFEISLNKLLDEDIKAKSKKLLEEYIKKLTSISEEFNGKGLNINLSDFVKGKLVQLNEDNILDSSIDTRTESHKEIRSQKVPKRARGLERLFNPKRWFNPVYEVEEDYEVEVKEEIYFISKEKLENQILGPIWETLSNERKRILEFAKEETNNIKDYFYEKFDEVDKILADKANELKKITFSQEESVKALKQANELLGQLEEIKNELESILEI